MKKKPGVQDLRGLKQILISQDLDFQKSRCRLKGQVSRWAEEFAISHALLSCCLHLSKNLGNSEKVKYIELSNVIKAKLSWKFAVQIHLDKLCLLHFR